MVATLVRVYSGDAENTMTPSRAAFFRRRNTARMAASARRVREAEEARVVAMTGVLPPESGRHVHAAPGKDYLGGILLTDGSVHLFDYSYFYHAEYAGSIGKSVVSGESEGPDGWAFYCRPDLNQDWVIGSGYMVPREYHAALNEVALSLLTS